MNKLLKDRVYLIRAMENAIKVLKAGNYIDARLLNVLGSIVSSIRANANGHFLSLSQEVSMGVSYAKSPETKYDSQRRIRTTLGKYIQRHFIKVHFAEHNIPDRMLTEFVSKVTAILASSTLKPVIVTGQEIVEQYRSAFGRKSQSCMTGEASKYTEFYAKNPDKVALVLWNGLRALLWTCDDGTKVLDRIYPVGHGLTETLRSWATSKGYVVRGVPPYIDSYELSDRSKRCVTMKRTMYIPYLDTFRTGTYKDDSNKRYMVITNNDNAVPQGRRLYLHCTDGSYIDNGVRVAPTFIPDDNTEFSCKYCKGRGIVSEGQGDWAHDEGFICKKCISNPVLFKCDACNKYRRKSMFGKSQMYRMITITGHGMTGEIQTMCPQCRKEANRNYRARDYVEPQPAPVRRAIVPGSINMIAANARAASRSAYRDDPSY